MEILAHGYEWGVHILMLSLLGFFVIILGGTLIYSVIDLIKGNVQQVSEFIALSVLAILFSLCVWVMITGINQGAKEYWKVKITDFNEIYENDYKIINQEGDIYRIEKKN